METDTDTQVIPLRGDEKEAPDRVLVRFHFTNPNHIPAGIPEVDRAEDDDVDSTHAYWARAQGLAKAAVIGRQRKGRVDTGVRVIDNLPDVQVAALRTGFTNNRFVLTDAHWFEHNPRDRRRKYVVCLTFSAIENGAELPELPRATLNALRELARTTWRFCHVWNNPDRVATINLVGRRWDDHNNRYHPPQHALVVRQGNLQAISVTHAVTEKEEEEIV